MPKNTTSPLDDLKVSYPCPTTWESMIGNDQVRYCNKCQLNVYNLSGMTKQQAEKLVSSNESQMCIAFYRRADGKVLTQNCPVGLAAVKQRVANTISLALSVLVTFFTAVGFYSFFGKTEPKLDNEPSKVKSLPVLDQKTTNQIETTTPTINQESTPINSTSYCNSNNKQINKSQVPEVGQFSVNYKEPKVNPFSDHSTFREEKTVGRLVPKNVDAICSQEVDKSQ